MESMIPRNCIASFVIFYIYFFLCSDAPQTETARLSIRLIIRKCHSDLGTIRYVTARKKWNRGM